MSPKDDGAWALSRRKLLKTSAAVGALYWFGPKLMFGGRVVGEAAAQTLVPQKYLTPLVIPPVMPPTDPNLVVQGGKNVAYYEIAVRQFQQQVLPSGPKTTVWSYGSETTPGTFNYPAFTIESRFKKPVRVRWINGLVAANGNFLPHLLPVDPTLHWANPPQGSDPAYGTGSKDSRPTFTSMPGRYTGPVPIVTHVHGQAGVGDESDGYAEAWYLPVAGIPTGYAPVGTWYNFFRDKAATKFGVAWGPGFAVFQYPNDQRASTIWYHDHTLGMTRLNVYAGPAGFWLVRGGPGDGNVKGFRAPQLGDSLGVVYTEIPIAIQDRSFNDNGSLFYPDSRAFSDPDYTGGYVPSTPISPIWNPEFFGNVMVVNGKSWPYLEVEPRRYRFRFLNGCDSRFLILNLVKDGGGPTVPMWVIGNEGGLLPAPVRVTTLPIGLAERFDVIVDFTGVAVDTTFTLKNLGPDGPFQGFNTDGSVIGGAADTTTTGQVMQVRVVPPTAKDQSFPVNKLNLPPIKNLTGGTPRRVALLEEMANGVVAEILLGIVTGNPNTGSGSATSKKWEDSITENPALGATEVWEIYNCTVDVHPIHIHETFFQVINRQDITFAEGGANIQVKPGSVPQSPQPFEAGFKDTVNTYPGQVTRVRLKFENPGNFVWHCHIVSHEDNEMMRPYRVGPVQPGSPA